MDHVACRQGHRERSQGVGLGKDVTTCPSILRLLGTIVVVARYGFMFCGSGFVYQWIGCIYMVGVDAVASTSWKHCNFSRRFLAGFFPSATKVCLELARREDR